MAQGDRSLSDDGEPPDVYRVGRVSAVIVSICVAVFGVSLVVGFWVETIMASFLVSLVLAPAFVAMMTSIHQHASDEKNIWSALGLAFAIIYAVMVTLSYYVQLSVVRTNPLQLSSAILDALIYQPGSMMFAVNMLGYGFMTLATLSAAPVFSGSELAVWIKRWFVFHGVLVVPTLVYPAVMVQGAADGGSDIAGIIALLAWCVIFLPLSIMVAVYFQRQSSAWKSQFSTGAESGRV